MLTYETGVLVAFLLWLWNVINAIVSINSLMERNLNIVGQRLSWLTMLPISMGPDDYDQTLGRKWLKFFVLHICGLLFALASWAYVVYVAVTYLHRRSKDAGAPEPVRALRWKLRNTEMTFDQLIKEFMKVAEQDPADFQKVRSEVHHDIEAAQNYKQDEKDFWEYENMRQALLVKFHRGSEMPATAAPPGYLHEMYCLNLDYEGMLRRRNGWTDSEFDEAREFLQHVSR